jgi:hypothetical protein
MLASASAQEEALDHGLDRLAPSAAPWKTGRSVAMPSASRTAMQASSSRSRS